MEFSEQPFRFPLDAVQRQQEWERDDQRAQLRNLEARRVNLSRESATHTARIAEEQSAFRTGAASVGSNLVARWSLLDLYTRAQIGKVVAVERQLRHVEQEFADQTAVVRESTARLKALENLRRRQSVSHEQARSTSIDRQAEEAWRLLAVRRTGKSGV